MDNDDLLPVAPPPRQKFEGVEVGPLDRGTPWWYDVDAFIESIDIRPSGEIKPTPRFKLPGPRGYNG